MPIIVAREDSLFNRLRAERVPVLDEDAALAQDMRPARIGLLNLMPAQVMETTEVQWLRHIGNTILQIEPVLLSFDNDSRIDEAGNSSKILRRYQSFSTATQKPLDALIVTGANHEVDVQVDATRAEVAFNDIRYAQQLREVIDWAREHVPHTIYSCLGAHFALNHLFGLTRSISDQKTAGVYEHTRTIEGKSSALTRDMNDVIRAPHSRWGNIATMELDRVGGMAILAANGEIGWLLAEVSNGAGGKDLFIQGHPEYHRSDLNTEYTRDTQKGLKPAIPRGYYVDNNPTQPVNLSWVSDARALHANWIGALYAHLAQPEPKR